jgi:hypothetical protein
MLSLTRMQRLPHRPCRMLAPSDPSDSQLDVRVNCSPVPSVWLALKRHISSASGGKHLAPHNSHASSHALDTFIANLMQSKFHDQEERAAQASTSKRRVGVPKRSTCVTNSCGCTAALSAYATSPIEVTAHAAVKLSCTRCVISTRISMTHSQASK